MLLSMFPKICIKIYLISKINLEFGDTVRISQIKIVWFDYHLSFVMDYFYDKYLGR